MPYDGTDCEVCGTFVTRPGAATALCARCARERDRGKEWRRFYEQGKAMAPPRLRAAALVAAFGRGYADARTGHPVDPPYRHSSHHGGTWGYQLHRCYREGHGFGGA
ncbi:MAG: hypothetical protein ACOC7J_06415 [Armatimonadota bacterium]